MVFEHFYGPFVRSFVGCPLALSFKLCNSINSCQCPRKFILPSFYCLALNDFLGGGFLNSASSISIFFFFFLVSQISNGETTNSWKLVAQIKDSEVQLPGFELCLNLLLVSRPWETYLTYAGSLFHL